MSRATPESLVVSVEFPLVFLISLIKSLKLPAEILLLPLQPGVVGREGGEDELPPGHLVLSPPVLASHTNTAALPFTGAGDR